MNIEKLTLELHGNNQNLINFAGKTDIGELLYIKKLQKCIHNL